MRLDIVIPAHNEQHRIDATLRAFRDRMTDPDVRFLVAMDCCTDATADIVARHSAADPRVVGLPYPKLGKGGVIMETLRRSDADVVGFVDADCATPPAEFTRLAEAVVDADMAIAARWHSASVLPARRPFSRRLESRVFAGAVRALFGLPYRDTQCGAKVFRREVAEAVLPVLSSRDFLFDVELLMATRAMGFRVVEVPTVWVDQAGSRLRAGHDGRRMALSALRLWFHLRTIPLPVSAGRRPVPLEPATEHLPIPEVLDLTEPAVAGADL
ncbi:MAG TPA: glycosyltransferase [Acidimicrobiales bacterium]|nr:glycosyltransferase [Acidimicrobiales bacterium]